MQTTPSRTGRSSRLSHLNRPLVVTGLLMLAVLGPFLAGIWLDPRTITGAPAWLKPAKFAVSIAVYTFTLAWVFTYLEAFPRSRRAVGWVSAVVFVLEMVIIAMQAWRGTTSHFNVGTTLDATLFSLMGAAIVVQTVTSIAVAVALWRQPFTDRALGWALRLGMAITIAGAFTGGLMTRPTEAQLAEARTNSRLAVIGAHTVGAPDGGPGLPGTGWSTRHGDLRVPHFIGLHALQLLPLVVLALGRRREAAARVRLALTAAASYAALFIILIWQALRGQSVLQPDATTAALLAAWAAATILIGWMARRVQSGHGRNGHLLQNVAR